jgi:hypothetical protein
VFVFKFVFEFVVVVGGGVEGACVQRVGEGGEGAPVERGR